MKKKKKKRKVNSATKLPPLNRGSQELQVSNTFTSFQPSQRAWVMPSMAADVEDDNLEVSGAAAVTTTTAAAFAAEDDDSETDVEDLQEVTSRTIVKQVDDASSSNKLGRTTIVRYQDLQQDTSERDAPSSYVNDEEEDSQGGNLLDGTFDEAAGHAAFQEALLAWRQARRQPQQAEDHPNATDVSNEKEEEPHSTQQGTSSEQCDLSSKINIPEATKGTNLSYLERLMLRSENTTHINDQQDAAVGATLQKESATPNVTQDEVKHDDGDVVAQPPAADENAIAFLLGAISFDQAFQS